MLISLILLFCFLSANTVEGSAWGCFYPWVKANYWKLKGNGINFEYGQTFLWVMGYAFKKENDKYYHKKGGKK